MENKECWNIEINIIRIFFSCTFTTFVVLRRDLLDETEAPQEHSCGEDVKLGVSGCTEGYLDGPYDFAYSRVDRY